MKRNITAHIISHTHWDREWYLTREVFRTKLVRLIDRVLDIIDADDRFVSFMMDGQAITIEDYLEVRPENEERLQTAMQSGRIVCGPWYILPDELLISGEAHIRNYMIGSELTKRYGKVSNVGYLPDSFGHPEQIPQIISGLGLEAMVFWRGVPNEVNETEFYLEAPGGVARTLCVNMCNGYGNVARLQNNRELNDRITGMIESLAGRSAIDEVLLMNGSDHIIPQDDIADIIENYNRTNEIGYIIRFTTLDDFIRVVNSRLKDIKTYRGEFRSGDRSMLLGGTLSTRMYLKQFNYIVQSKMERYLEPLNVAGILCGSRGLGRGYAGYIWRKILENHPHDSICGCSIDEVHREMMTRFESLSRLQDELIDRSIKQIGDLAGGAGGDDCQVQLLVFEPDKDRNSSYVEVDIDFDAVLVQEVNFGKSIIEDYEPQITHPDLPENVVITDCNGNEVKSVVLSAGKYYYKLLKDETAPEIYKVNRVRLGLWLENLDYGVHLLNAARSNSPAGDKACSQGIKCEEFGQYRAYAENEYYRVEYDRGTSSFTVTDKKNNRVFTCVNRFVDKGDAGDEYTYSWPEKDTVYCGLSEAVLVETEATELWQRMTVKAVMELPEALTEDRKARSGNLVSCRVKIIVTLEKNTNRIDFETEFDNAAKDHRLQVEFPSGVLSGKSRSSGAFAMTERNVDIVVPQNWMEYPQTTHPTHGIVDVREGSRGITLSTAGTTEYEVENVENQSMVRLTLLRCVGWLSRTDLLTRHGNGGWTIETPEAQCLGLHRFRYSAIFADGSSLPQDVALAERAIYRPVIRQIWTEGRFNAPVNPLGFLSELPKAVRISAVKQSEKGDGIIIRVYSICDEDTEVKLHPGKQFTEAYLTDLKESRISRLCISEGEVSFVVRGREIKTIELG